MTEERKVPDRLQKEMALSRRLRKNHPKLPKILNSIEARKAGYRGEQNVDYHLTFLLKNKYTIIRGIELSNQFSFQIDTLLLSPELFFLIEIKNYAGTLIFDNHSKQMIQENNNTEKGYPNPIQQAERQIIQLKNWLEKHKFPQVPIEYFIVISHARTILKSNDPSIFKKIIHADHLINKISEIQKYYSNPSLSEKILRKLIKTVNKESSPSSSNILDFWEIPLTDLLPGVHCPYCQNLSMLRMPGKWYCPFCKNDSKDAHVQAIEDFFLLFGPTITNKKCREFLLIPSRRTAEHILKSMNLIAIGTTKGIHYRMKI